MDRYSSRVVVFGAGLLLAGCVQQEYIPPPPIQLQPYAPAIPYRTDPMYSAPSDAPVNQFPIPGPLDSGPPPSDTAPSDNSGPIPLQDLPAPVPDSAPGSPAAPGAAPADTSVPSPAPVAVRPPSSGPGSNVPLEGFRPMRGQTRPAP